MNRHWKNLKFQVVFCLLSGGGLNFEAFQMAFGLCKRETSPHFLMSGVRPTSSRSADEELEDNVQLPPGGAFPSTQTSEAPALGTSPARSLHGP